MTIYRGVGGGGDATSDIEITTIAASTAAAAASAASAATSATNADTSATNAANSAASSSSSAASASSSDSAASASASAAATSASNASTSASAASTSATNASTSASTASTQASNASTSATNASTSASTATTQAGIATTQASNAATSASGASTSASTATTQASNASTSATNAASSASAAAAARDQALAAFDNFDDKYLGEKATDPTVDNDGNALLTGALYFNTGSAVMKVYTGSAWVAAYVSGAGTLVAANNLSDVSSVSTSRTNLGLGTLATQNANAVAITGGTITGLSSALPVASGGTGTTTSTGSGSVVLSTSPTLVTPALGTPSALVGTNITGTAAGLSIGGNAATATTATNQSGGTVSATSISDSGNLTFTGTGNRITGDFSNATIANRVAFQSSTTNSATILGVIPNGTSTNGQLWLFGNSDPANTSILQLAGGANSNAEVRIASTITGTGTYLPMTFYTNGSERVRIDTSGNVGIGTSSPATKLHVKSGNSNQLTIDNDGSQYTSTFIQNNGTTKANFYWDNTNAIYNINAQAASSQMALWTANTERMRIDSSGNVGIGTASPSAKFQVDSSSATYSANIRARNSNFGNGVVGAASGILTVATDMNNIAFYTGSNLGVGGTSVPTNERMRINSSGVLCVGTAGLNNNGTAISASGSSRVARIYGTTESDGPLMVDKSSATTTTSQVYIQFSVNGQATACGQINANGAGAAAFGTFSDARLKENVVELTPQLDNILALRPVEFDYIESEGGGHQTGFIAQEMQKVYPDSVGERGPDGMLTVTGWNKTEARLVKAIQEQQALITSLTTRLTALEAK